jgi:hypothetical protein
MRNNIDLAPIFRDKVLLADIRAEVKRQALTHWRPWQVKLPPDLIWPMVSEVSDGMMLPWSPTLDGIGVQVGNPNEVDIEFVLEGMKVAPVKTRSLPYTAPRGTEPIEVRRGTPVRV